MRSFDAHTYPNGYMTVVEFNRLSNYIYTNYGIKLPITKKVMLEGRLQKRLRILNLPTFKEYCEYVFSAEGQKSELHHMIDAVATNKTDFFREASHFDFLLSAVLPQYLKEYSPPRPLKIWSAGCSTGEEPYTLGMVLSEFSVLNFGFTFDILATDISTRALTAAATGIYTEDKVTPVPLSLKKRYLLRSKDADQATVRIIPALRSKVNFKRLNFIDGDISSYENFQVIFCRNVLIYFDRPTQEKVILKLCSKLARGGYLFLGHSESISNMNLPLIQIQSTTFRKV